MCVREREREKERETFTRGTTEPGWRKGTTSREVPVTGEEEEERVGGEGVESSAGTR